MHQESNPKSKRKATQLTGEKQFDVQNGKKSQSSNRKT